jgi:hypothetical protein
MSRRSARLADRNGKAAQESDIAPTASGRSADGTGLSETNSGQRPPPRARNRFAPSIVDPPAPSKGAVESHAAEPGALPAKSAKEAEKRNPTEVDHCPHSDHPLDPSSPCPASPKPAGSPAALATRSSSSQTPAQAALLCEEFGAVLLSPPGSENNCSLWVLVLGIIMQLSRTLVGDQVLNFLQGQLIGDQVLDFQEGQFPLQPHHLISTLRGRLPSWIRDLMPEIKHTMTEGEFECGLRHLQETGDPGEPEGSMAHVLASAAELPESGHLTPHSFDAAGDKVIMFYTGGHCYAVVRMECLTSDGPLSSIQNLLSHYRIIHPRAGSGPDTLAELLKSGTHPGPASPVNQCLSLEETKTAPHQPDMLGTRPSEQTIIQNRTSWVTSQAPLAYDRQASNTLVGGIDQGMSEVTTRSLSPRSYGRRGASSNKSHHCPAIECGKEFKLFAKMMNHVEKQHGIEVITDTILANRGWTRCPECNRPYDEGPLGKRHRHKCREGHSSQPYTAQSQETFVQQAKQQRHARQREAIMDSMLPYGRRQRAKRQVRHKQHRKHLLETLAAIHEACNPRDTTRITALFTTLLEPFQADEQERENIQGPGMELPGGEYANEKRCVLILKKGGRPSKARAALTASALFQVTDENVHLITGTELEDGTNDGRGQVVPRMENLECNSQDIWSAPGYEVTLDENVVLETLGTRDPTTGRGPSGMGYRDLQELTEEPGFVKHLTSALGAILNSAIEPESNVMKALLTARLVTLTKANGMPRCISVRETLLNLAYAVLVRQYRGEITKHLSESDIGFGTADAAAGAILTLTSRIQRARNQNQPRVVLKLDVANAYGTTKRNRVLQLLNRKLPVLVRPFLVAYKHATRLKIRTREHTINVMEGLLQGDPAAPAFAQLLYADCCEQVRNEVPDLELLISYFDDMCLFGSIESVREALERLAPILEEVGLRINLEKCLAYTTSALEPEDEEWFRQMGIEARQDGLEFLGSPIGNDRFIQDFLTKKADNLINIIERVRNVHQMSRVETRWAAPQGLHALTQLSLNQILRHLTRTVDPRHIRDHLQRADVAMMQLQGRLFDMKDNEFTTWRAQRITLPYRYGGMGLITLADTCQTAFLGAVYRHGHNLLGNREDWVPGFEEAHVEVARQIGEVEIPKTHEFFMTRADKRMARGDVEDLGPRLMDKVWSKKQDAFRKMGSDEEKFIVSVTNTETSFDVLRAPTTNLGYRVDSHAFVMAGRVRLALPVTRRECPLCNDKINFDGQHASAKHCEKRRRTRHDEVARVITRVFRSLEANYDFPYRVSEEAWLTEVEGIIAKKETQLRCDIMLRPYHEGLPIFYDVSLIHPDLKKKAHWVPKAATEERWMAKRHKYLSHHNISQEDIQPLVFDTYGGYSKGTLSHLFKIVGRTCTFGGKINERLRDQLWMDLRYRIATTIAREQAKVVGYFNHLTRGLKTQLPIPDQTGLVG